MAEVSYINPLSNEGKGIIRNYGDLNQIFDEDESLIEICTRTTNQRLSDYNIIPKSFHDLALKRIQWAIEKKNNKNFTQAEFEYFVSQLQKNAKEHQVNISYGVVWREMCENLEDLLTEADKKMYEDKKLYYSNTKHNRRGQIERNSPLCTAEKKAM